MSGTLSQVTLLPTFAVVHSVERTPIVFHSMNSFNSIHARKMTKPSSSSTKPAMSFEERVTNLLSTIKWGVQMVYFISIGCMIALAIPIFFLTLHVYKPLALVLVLLTGCAIYYLHSKRSTVNDIISRVEEITTRNKPSTSKEEKKKTNIVQRAVTTAVDTGISSAAEAAMLLPMGIAIIGVIAALIGYLPVGIVFVVIAVAVLAIINYSCAGVKFMAHNVVDRWLGSESRKQDDETTPLIT